MGLEKKVLIRKHPLARGVRITGKELESEWVEDKSIWKESEIDPDEKDMRLMFAVALQREVEFIMLNHIWETFSRTGNPPKMCHFVPIFEGP